MTKTQKAGGYMELIFVKPQCGPVNWGDPGPWGLVPASPEGVAEVRGLVSDPQHNR